MAMYEFKDSEDIKITNSTTTAEKLLKTDNVKKVLADNCHAGVAPDQPMPAPEQSTGTKVREWVVENMIVSVFAIIAAVATAITLTYLGLGS